MTKIDSNIPQPNTPPSVNRSQPVTPTGTIKGHTVVHSIPASQIKSKMNK